MHLHDTLTILTLLDVWKASVWIPTLHMNGRILLAKWMDPIRGPMKGFVESSVRHLKNIELNRRILVWLA